MSGSHWFPCLDNSNKNPSWNDSNWYWSQVSRVSLFLKTKGNANQLFLGNNMTFSVLIFVCNYFLLNLILSKFKIMWRGHIPTLLWKQLMADPWQNYNHINQTENETFWALNGRNKYILNAGRVMLLIKLNPISPTAFNLHFKFMLY